MLCSFWGLKELYAQPEAVQKVYFFYSEECDVCQVQLEEVKAMAEDSNSFSLATYEISTNRENLELLFYLLDRFAPHNFDFSIPVVFIGSQALIGEQDIGNSLEIYLNQPDAQFSDATEEAVNQFWQSKNQNQDTAQKFLTIPAVIGAAAIDSINPCAIAIILFLISSLFLSADRKKVLIYGSIYIGTIFLVYLGLGLGFIYFLKSINISSLFFVVVGALLILAGLLSLKDYFWYGKGPSLGLPGPIKQSIQHHIEKATVASVITVGILISIFESTCSGAIYLGILSLVSSRGLDARLMGLLLLYNFIFVLPLIVIMVAFYFGFPVKKINRWLIQKKRKAYRLITGIVLISLGVYLIIYFQLAT